MTEAPFCSVIIPTYNRAEFIKLAVESALIQWSTEVIVIDDGSTDNTSEVLMPYVNSGQVVYRWQQNSGRCVARNQGATLAKGHYLLFLDSDDLLEKNAILNLSVLEKASKKKGLFAGKVGLFSGTNLNSVDFHNHFNYESTFVEKRFSYETVQHIFLSIGAFIIPVKTFVESGGFLKKFEPAEDLDFSMKNLSANYFTWSADFVVVNKRRHESNTNDRALHLASERTCKHYIELIENGKMSLNRQENRKFLSNLYQRLLNDCLYLNKKVHGTNFFLLMIRYNPLKAFNFRWYKQIIYLWFFRKD